METSKVLIKATLG